MSTRLPSDLDISDGSDRPGAVQRVVMGDSAVILGKLGGAVEATLARLRAIPVGDDHLREEAEYACAEAVWRYFVQREACGLARHERVIETYEIPGAVLAKVGAVRPPRDDG